MKTRNAVPFGLTAKILLTTILFALALAPAARAATNTVTSTADTGAGSLRNTIASSASGDTITFDPSLSGQTITLTSGQLTLSNNLTIDASSLPGGIAVSGNYNSRVFEVLSTSTVLLNSLQVRDGFVIDVGGGIRNTGNLTLNRCTVSGNTAGDAGGGIESPGGTLTLNQCTLTGNGVASFGIGGGAISFGFTGGTLTVSQSTLSGNIAPLGGGIYNAGGSLAGTNSIVAGNSQDSGGDIEGGTLTGVNLTSGNPLLAPLGNYGGPTPTMPPLSGSLAIDGCTNGTGFTTDQRGFPRIVGAYADIGAVEAALSFTSMPIAGLPGVVYSSVAWADYDNDGHLDFLLTGYSTNGPVSQLWRNTGSGFTNVTDSAFPSNSLPVMSGFPSIGSSCALAWGDYDNDGRLDLLIAGLATNAFVTQLWRNTGGGFTNVPLPGVPAVRYGLLAWGDSDNDGRLDFLLTGLDANSDYRSQLWRNTGSGFTNVPLPGVPGLMFSSVAWGDYDNDGHLDFLLTGSDDANLSHFRSPQLWRNTGTGFTNVPLPGVPEVGWGSLAWGDYDNDGRLDFLLTGTDTNSVGYSQLWRNTGSGFTNVTDTAFPSNGLAGVFASSLAWGDYDNDGRLDFLLTGVDTNSDYRSQLWRNNGDGTFSNVTATAAAGLPGVGAGSGVWGDYDNDGRLDFLFTGYYYDGNENYVSQLWHNITPVTNAPPAAPTGLAMTATTNAVMLSWNSAVDDHTPATGLAYNVRAGTTPGGIDLFAGHVDATNGFRRVPALGNAMLRLTLPLTGVTSGQTVYWSVQAVDTSFAGGSFATETSVVSIPQLSITSTDTTNALVSWTPPTFGWHLEETPALNPPAWTNSPSGELNPASVSTTNPATSYRLKSQ